MRLLYTSDLHGSDACFRKLLDAIERHHVDCAVVGGDLTGKFVVPIVSLGGGEYELGWGEPPQVTEAVDAEALLADLAERGRYGVRLSRAERDSLRPDGARRVELLARLADKRFARWLEVAERRLRAGDAPLYLQPGNEDRPSTVELLDRHERRASLGAAGSRAALARVRNPEGRLVELPGGHVMLSMGVVNTTPFHSARQVDDAELGRRIDAMARRIPADRRLDAVFNIHAPPRDSGLDLAYRRGPDFRPLVENGAVLRVAAGSAAVRTAIEEHQPLLGLHGHIHESPGTARIGRTLCVNLGTEYEKGALVYGVFDLRPGEPPRREVHTV